MIYDHSWMISDHLRSWIQSNFQWKSWRIKNSIKNSSSEFIYQCKKQKYLSLEYLYQNKKEYFEFRNKKSWYRNSKISKIEWSERDRRSLMIIDRIMSHDHSQSWLLGSNKYEPHSLMIGNDREWSPITFRSPYHWNLPILQCSLYKVYF